MRGADLVIVNTCGFIDAAVEASFLFRGGRAGEIRNVTIERAGAHDLYGRLT